MFARLRLPKFVMQRLSAWYCRKFAIDLSEYQVPEEGFRSLDELFTRKVKPTARKVDKAADVLVSPVDARVDQMGKITDATLIQAKGISYSLADLLPSQEYKHFVGGSFVTLYLSPADYHRIHSPAKGRITGFFHIPGKLYTVQEFMVSGLPGLFCINERLVSYITAKTGRIAVCKIGAMNVGRISLSYANAVTNKFIRKKQETFFDKQNEVKVNAGDEIAVFHLGSTIILLLEKGTARFSGIKLGSKVKAGQTIGRLTGK